MALRERERERSVEHVARADRIDGFDREDRALPQGDPLAPEHIPRSLSDGEKR